MFEAFRLDPVRRSLTRNGSPVAVSARLFDTLLCLVTRHPDWVQRDEIMRVVWQGRVADERNVSKAISSLRAVLTAHGAPDSLIVTGASRGYRLAVPVVAELGTTSVVASDVETRQSHRLETGGQAARLRPVWLALAAAALLLGGLSAWRVLMPPVAEPSPAAPFDPPPHTLAVLPFANISDDRQEDYLAIGMSDEITTTLARIPDLRVVAQQSAETFRGKSLPLVDIARRLNVGELLLGTVRRDGTRIRITVRLVDAMTGYQIWTQSYDRQQGALLAIEGDIAMAVMTSLKLVLLPDVASQLNMGGTSNAGAFDALLAGIARGHDPNPAIAATAIGFFDKAIALDPSYAHAYVIRSFFLTGGSGATQEGASDAEHAIRLAPDLGEAHAAWAYALRDKLDFRMVDVEIRRAMALAPSNDRVLMAYATVLWDFGHLAEAVDVARQAVSLNPVSLAPYRVLAFSLALDGRFADARATIGHAQSLRLGNDPVNGKVLATIAMFEGNAAAARDACEGRKDFMGGYCLAWAYHRLGRQAEADAEFTRLRAAYGDPGAFQYAEIYASWGNKDEAVRWLNTAFRLRDPGLSLLHSDPLLKPIAATPDYARIEAAIGFPH